MRFEEFIKYASKLPVIDTELLLAGVSDPKPVKVQITRWEKSGKLIQLKRGIYLLANTYRKIDVYEPYIAALLKRPSYISLEKALEFHGLIPEAVPVYTCVTPKRQAKFTSKIGTFIYRHIKNTLFWGYESVTVNKQTAFFAAPEKALLDLIYLNDIKVSPEYLEELRLQNVSKIGLDKLSACAKKFGRPGMLRAAGVIKDYILSYQQEAKEL